MITVEQVKAARALLRWTQENLAKKSRVSYPTIARIESARGPLGGRQETGEKIIRALEAAGVELIEQDNGGPGVRLKKTRRR